MVSSMSMGKNVIMQLGNIQFGNILFCVVSLFFFSFFFFFDTKLKKKKKENRWCDYIF